MRECGAEGMPVRAERYRQEHGKTGGTSSYLRKRIARNICGSKGRRSTGKGLKDTGKW